MTRKRVLSNGRGPERVAVITSKLPPVWMSCRIITPNLVRAYQEAFGENVRYFSFTTESGVASAWEIAGQIHQMRPERLVFLDHDPHPEKLILALEAKYYPRPLPPLYVHLYGDFTLHTGRWLKLEKILQRTRIKFICASPRQVELVSRLIGGDPERLGRCPFPVDCDQYKPSDELRRKWRAQLGAGDKDFAVLYAGRMSLQKNVILLAEQVMSLAATSGRKVWFWCAGPFDDIGAPFFGLQFPTGSYQTEWMNFLAKIPATLRSRIKYLGNLGARDLTGVYNAADVYASLSLHHDEDFGMAPAEALCCGTPVVLSDWGGYTTFGTDESSSAFVPVRIHRKGLRMSEGEALCRLSQRMLQDAPVIGRAETAKRYAEELSIEAAAKIITDIHGTEAPVFDGFDWGIRHFSERFGRGTPFPEGPRKGTFYERIYGAYASPEI